MEGDCWEGSWWVGKGAGRTELWPTLKDPEQISLTSWSSDTEHGTPLNLRNATTILARSLCRVHGSGGSNSGAHAYTANVLLTSHLLGPYCLFPDDTCFD